MNSFYRFLEILFRKIGLFPGWVGANGWPLGLGILPFFQKHDRYLQNCEVAGFAESPMGGHERLRGWQGPVLYGVRGPRGRRFLLFGGWKELRSEGAMVVYMFF